MSLPPSNTSSRHRLTLLVGILSVIGLGLASRAIPGLFPALFGKYPGDVLWALMVYLGWAFCKPAARPGQISRYTLITATLIEASQLIQTTQLNAIRHTTLGHLILGTTFSWADLFTYLIGIGFGFWLDHMVLFRASHHDIPPTNTATKTP